MFLATLIGVTDSARVHAAEKATYLTAAQLDLVPILGPPPAAGSKAQSQDLALVIAIQHAATPDEMALAIADAQVSIARVADVLGAPFGTGALPLTEALLAGAMRDTNKALGAAKSFYARPRPFAVSSEVKLPITVDPRDSYPSGHTTYAYVHAILLAAMVPEKSAELFARAAQYGRNRVVVGVHYPTDVAAGRTVASIVTTQLLLNAGFRTEFDAARSELRAALKLAATPAP